MVRKRKAPRTASEPGGAKEARGRVTDQDLKSNHNKFEWSLALADYDGKWGFTTEVFRSEWCGKILQKLKNYESNKWTEIANPTSGRSSGTRNHHVVVSNLIKSAKKRLRELDLDDLDQLYSLRLEGKVRLYGVVHGHVFKIIWYDTNHEICPSKPRKT